MRLLHAKTKRLEEFIEGRGPRYAILSHTWGAAEVTFKDIERNGYTPGWPKIDGCCEQALKDGLEYVWIDTCCIDKSSSAELSEAINSMWAWYKEAAACYAYLSDTPHGSYVKDEDSAFGRSRWFKRGWTLQELIAPRRVSFYDESWGFVGRKSSSPMDASFTRIVSQITKIPSELLVDDLKLMSASVAQKMSWAAGRTTTRTEDVAYSLLGLFNVSMSMLYGEGSRAFIRLQEEIIKSSDDESIFAWGFSEAREDDASLLASSPADFANCGSLRPFTPAGIKSSHYSMTNKGLHIEMSICNISTMDGTSFGRLNCSSFQERGSKSIALPLVRSCKDENTFSRFASCAPVLVPSTLFLESTRAHVYLHRKWAGEYIYARCGLQVQCWSLGKRAEFPIYEIYPPAWRDGLLGWSFMLNYQEYLELKQQSVIFLCENDHWPNFAVRIDYDFQMVDRNLLPRELQYYAAFVEEGKALAEIMIKNRGGMEAALDWQGSLDFGDTELIFRLDKTKPRLVGLLNLWILNIEIRVKQGQSHEMEE